MKTTMYLSLFILALSIFVFWGCGTSRTGVQEPGVAASTGPQVGKYADERGQQQIEDASISSAIRMKFAVDKLLCDSDIHVDTSHRDVTLNGKVDTQEEADRALHLGRSVDGVRTVHSKLIVKAAGKK